MATSKVPKISALFTHYAGTIPENESNYLNETIPTLYNYKIRKLWELYKLLSEKGEESFQR